MQSGSLLSLLITTAAVVGAFLFAQFEKSILLMDARIPEVRTAPQVDNSGPEAPQTGLDEGSPMEILQRRVQRLEEQNQMLEADNRQLRQDLSDEKLGKEPPPEAAQIIADVEKVRKIKFTAAPTFATMPLRQIQEKAKAAVLASLAPEVLAARARGYFAMGFLEQADDIRTSLSDLTAYQANYYHDPASNQIFVQDDASLGTKIGRDRHAMAAAQVLLAQQFPTAPSKWSDTENDDAIRAARALTAGDINYTRLQFSLQDAYPEKDIPSPEEPVPPYAPLLLMEEMKFVNDAGAAFVEQIWQMGSAVRLQEAYQRPPKSTAEIIHPAELYFATPHFQPTEIPPNALAIPTPLFTNVAGELGILLILQGGTDRDRTLRAASGWLGDRYWVFPGTRELGDHVVWKTTWTSESEATEFLEEMSRHFMARYSLPWQEKQFTKTSYTVNDPNRIIRIRILPDGKSVSIINATDAAFADAAEKALTP